MGENYQRDAVIARFAETLMLHINERRDASLDISRRYGGYERFSQFVHDCLFVNIQRNRERESIARDISRTQ